MKKRQINSVVKNLLAARLSDLGSIVSGLVDEAGITRSEAILETMVKLCNSHNKNAHRMIELVSIGPKKIQVIIAVRQYTDFGLRRAKIAVENRDTFIPIREKDLEHFAKALEDAGATVRLV